MSFSIRRIYDDNLPVNRRAIDQIIEITRRQIADMTEESLEFLRNLLRNPYHRRMRYFFFVVDDGREVKGFAMMSYAQDLKFCYLDLLAMKNQRKGSGIGGAVYERVREEALNLKAAGIFIECLTDSGRFIRDPILLRQNRARLKFYEQFGARPLLGTQYEAHSRNRYSYPYFLLYDDLDQKRELGQAQARRIIRAILLRKYDPPASPREINGVLRSLKDDPVRLREPRYIRKEMAHPIRPIPDDRKILLICNEESDIAHVKERGYVEAPVRIRTVLRELERTPYFLRIKSRRFAERFVRDIHDPDYVRYLKQICRNMEPGRSLYAEVFPIWKSDRPPRRLAARAGYYGTDVFSPLHRNTYDAARGAVNCALTGAVGILEGARTAYALVRPPGHHADKNSFGGFSYFNSAAVAAHYLSRYGRVALLDIDYHHGSGHQEIFYARQSVFTLSIHADPDYEYPYFSGFRGERGKGAGEGYNVNYPLPDGVTGGQYLTVLKRALREIRSFGPDFLVLSLGFDTAKGDPTGTWKLQKTDFRNNGRLIGALGVPVLVVQEGGYNSRLLGVNARYFFTGLWEGVYQ